MDYTPKFDLGAAHRYLSACCFNLTWIHLEKSSRTPAENEEMRSLAHASLWHWQQRPDIQPRNLSIAYWLLSRVYAVLGRAADAAEYGHVCLIHTPPGAPLLEGYAHEALARAALLNFDRNTMERHLALARERLPAIAEEKERLRLATDLAEIATLAEKVR